MPSTYLEMEHRALFPKFRNWIMKKPKVKICCIQSIEEAELAIKYGASAIGLVSEMPSGPGVISEDLINKIAAAVPSTIDTFLIP